jgi:DedD protein
VPKSGWVVQVGAFANADTARNLQAKLSKQGYHAYTEKAGSVVRVRIGSFPTREAAEKIQSKLETQGTHSNVLNLE